METRRVLRSRTSTSVESSNPVGVTKQESSAANPSSSKVEPKNAQKMVIAKKPQKAVAPAKPTTVTVVQDDIDELPFFGLSELALAGVEQEEEEEQPVRNIAVSSSNRKRVRNPPKEPVICSVCGQNFTRRAHLVRHFYLHTGEKPFKCFKCEQSFNRKDHLTAHLRGHDELNHKCRYCKVEFTSMDLLRSHILKNHSKQKKDNQTAAAIKASTAASTTTSFGFKIMTCQHCDKKFTQAHLFTAHLATHDESALEEDDGTELELPANIDVEKALNVYVSIDSDERHQADLHFKSTIVDDAEDDEGSRQYSTADEEAGGEDESEENAGDDDETADQDEETYANQQDGSEPKHYECVVCARKFKDQGSLRRHYKLHKRNFICRFCGIKMASAGSLMRHNLLHTGDKPFKCEICDRRFSRKDALKAHLAAHEKGNSKLSLPRPYQCQICTASYTMRYNLIRHVRQTHQQNGSFNVDDVLAMEMTQQQQQPVLKSEPEEFVMQNEAFLNSVGEQSDDPLKCGHCGKVFSSMKSLNTHVWYHNQEKRFICKICNHGFRYLTDLNRHSLTHRRRKPVSIAQQMAQNRLTQAKQQQTPRQRAAPVHNSVMINGVRHYPCSVCGQVFNHRSNRSRHMRVVHDNQISTNQVQQQQQQQRWPPLAKRMKTATVVNAAAPQRFVPPPQPKPIHLKQQPLQRRVNLSVDSDEPPPNYNGMYRCEFCKKIFDKRYSYKLHLRTHNKQYTCSICGLRTASQGDLTLHIRTHTGEKPFQCSQCEWRFCRRSALTVHIRRHHGPNSKVRRHYNPQRANPNMVKTEAELADGVPSPLSSSSSASSILKTVLQKKPPAAAEISQPVRKNLPPPPPLLRYPFPQKSQVVAEVKEEPVAREVKVALADGILYACRFCSQVVTGRVNLAAHLLHEHGTVDSVAPERLKSTRLSGEAETSIIRQTTTSSPPALQRRPISPIKKQQQLQPTMSCKLCDEVLPTRHELTVHTLAFHSDDDDYLLCGVCRKRCSTLDFLSRHYQYVHPNVKNAAEEARILLSNNSYDVNHETAENMMLVPEIVIKEEETQEGRNDLVVEVNMEEEQEEDDNDLSFIPEGLLSTDYAYPADESAQPPLNIITPTTTSASAAAAEPSFECPLCSKKFKDKKALADHKWYHSREAIHPCTMCPKKFKLKNDLIRHNRRHLQDRPHACTESGCEFRFYQKADLDRHLAKMHGHVQSALFPCSYCPIRFTLEINLLRHLKASHAAEHAAAAASQLAGSSKKKESQQTQEMEDDSPDYSYELQQLEIDTFNEENIDYAHMLQQQEELEEEFPEQEEESELGQEVVNNSGPPYKCQICGKVYEDRQKFIYHRYYHTRELRYPCPYCEEKFKIKGHVERHINTYHNSAKPPKEVFHCPVVECQRKFTRDYDLAKHLQLIHKRSPAMTGNNGGDLEEGTEFEIEIDSQDEEQNVNEGGYWLPEDEEESGHGQSSKQSSLLQPCMRKLEEYTNDNGELCCKPCNKHFKDLKSLQSHVYYHQREPKHPCEHCGARFKQKSDLRRHIKIHHDPNNPKDVTLNCPQCFRVFTDDRYLRIHLKKNCGQRTSAQGSAYSQEEEEGEEGLYVESSYMQDGDDDMMQGGLVQFEDDEQQEGQVEQGDWEEEGGEEIPDPLMFVSSDMQVDMGGEQDQEDYEGEEEEAPAAQTRFECNVCGIFFSRSNELILHKRSHVSSTITSGGAAAANKSASGSSSSSAKNKNKTFNCDKCGMSFLQKGDLTQHLQRYHLDELPVFECQFCPKFFYVKKSLDTHRRRHHSNVLNFHPCKVCGVRFVQKEFLVNHMKTHHTK